jgi:N-acetylmuramoyl-L-alanine amidase
VILRHGDTGPGVTEVRQRLRHLGLDTVASSGEDQFDDDLESALRVFQQSRGLTVDGIAGPQTLRRLEEARWSLGDRVLSYTPSHVVHGEDVAQLQQRMLELGFTLDKVDGVFGPITDRAVREFQRNVGLADDGIAGPEVYTALGRLARTVIGGNQEHLRELASWDAGARTATLDAAGFLLDPSDNPRPVMGTGMTEADVCWDVANRLEGRLLAAGSLVVLSRSAVGVAGDEAERARLANEQQLDLVLSLRCDHHLDARARGAATYYFGHEYSRSATGMRLAELVQEEVVQHTGLTDCRAHPKTWDLLRMTRMPAVRIEVGYASSPIDGAALGNAATRDAIAAAIYSAIGRVFAPRIG